MLNIIKADLFRILKGKGIYIIIILLFTLKKCNSTVLEKYKTDQLELLKKELRNKELGLLFTIKNNMKTLNSFHFEVYNKEFRIIKDSDIFDILKEDVKKVHYFDNKKCIKVENLT